MPDLIAGQLLPVLRCNPLVEGVVERSLPAGAQVLVQAGEWVTATQPIARLADGGRRDLHVVDVAGALDLPSRDLSSVMLKRRGDPVQMGEMLAAHSGKLPFLYRPCRAPVAGQIAAIAHGWVVIETAREALDIPALVAGQVREVIADRAVMIAWVGALIEGVCALGGTAVGVLHTRALSSSDSLSLERITEAARGAIVVIGGTATPEIVGQAAAVGAAGIVAGSIAVEMVNGTPLPVIATEGYGHLQMAADRFDLLKQLSGRPAAIIAKSPCPPGAQSSPEDCWQRGRPAVVVPDPDRRPGQGNGQERRAAEQPVQPAGNSAFYGSLARQPWGNRVRAVRAPFAGCTGEMVTPGGLGRVPAPSGEDFVARDDTGQTASGFGLRGTLVRFDVDVSVESMSGQPVHWVPWLNMESTG